MLGWGDPGAAYSAVLQLGSVIAVLSYFRGHLIKLAVGSFKALKEKNYASEEFRISAGIAIGTIPICIIGLFLKGIIEHDNSPLRALWLIGVVSIVMGVLLLVAEKIGSQKRNLYQMGIKDGLLVGLGQAMALIPGCSRSGSTLTVSLFLGLNRADSARFSFLLGIPAIVLSGLVELKEMLEVGLGDSAITSLAVGLLSSTVVSYLSIAWLIKYLERHSTKVFVIYRILFGIVVLWMAFK